MSKEAIFLHGNTAMIEREKSAAQGVCNYLNETLSQALKTFGLSTDKESVLHYARHCAQVESDYYEKVNEALKTLPHFLQESARNEANELFNEYGAHIYDTIIPDSVIYNTGAQSFEVDSEVITKKWSKYLTSAAQIKVYKQIQELCKSLNELAGMGATETALGAHEPIIRYNHVDKKYHVNPYQNFEAYGK